MSRWAPLLGALVLVACEKPAGPAPSIGLRVPLPEGWRAAGSPESLSVGPEGRVVLQLEPGQRPMPTVEALVAAVTAEGAQVTEKESEESFVGVQYLIGEQGAQRPAFLGVRSTGGQTIWCATTAGASAQEVERAQALCRTLAFGGTP